MSDADPYRAGPCPVCGRPAVMTFRHPGAPVQCHGGHRWRGTCGHAGCANTPVVRESAEDALRKELVGRIGDYAVYLVDGEGTRLDVNNDFTGGGNGEAYPGDDPPGQCPNRAVPRGELWIERGDPRTYLPYLMHELVEVLRMRYAGEEYKVAHLFASQAEALVRQILAGRTQAGVDSAAALAYRAMRRAP